MTLQQIYYALEIAQYGTMSGAAEKLFISQPTLTTAIKELENELGIQIFSRTNKGVNLTREGQDFLENARQVYQQYELLVDKYSDASKVKQKFGVSTQHYSFAVKAFVATVKNYDTLNYEFSINETRTLEVVTDVARGKSDIGILFQSSFNQNYMSKLLGDHGLEFHPLGECKASVYLHDTHPLADKAEIEFEDLKDYPCLSFDQGDNGSIFLAEEILSDREYDRVIKANDRSTMLNLMVGLNGYTLCSGVICEELNGDGYRVVPFKSDKNNPNSKMRIGYIVKKGSKLNSIGELYIEEIKKYIN